MIAAPIADLRGVIGKRDAQAFEPAFDALTKACNDCHRATNFGFNVVQRPAMNPYSNQAFASIAK
jgi:hypothetical protein